jgi:hypothetical protein
MLSGLLGEAPRHQSPLDQCRRHAARNRFEHSRRLKRATVAVVRLGEKKWQQGVLPKVNPVNGLRYLVAEEFGRWRQATKYGGCFV